MLEFLHVFLLVLKILGFVLAGILGLVLLILLIVCLVPIRYKGNVRYLEKANGYFRVTWLLHAVSAKLLITDNHFDTKIRILGFIKIGEKKKKDTEEETSGPDESLPENEWQPDEEEIHTEEQTSTQQTDTVSNETVQKKKKPTFIEFYQQKIEQLSDYLSVKIEEWYDKFCEKYKEFWKKYRDIIRKLHFLQSERVQAAIKHVMKHLLKVLKSFLPKKIKGKLKLGLSNPADTGTVYGIICATMPIHKNSVQVTPNFEEQELDADLIVAGRIFIGYILIRAIAMILNRNVIYVLRNYKKYFGKKAEK